MNELSISKEIVNSIKTVIPYSEIANPIPLHEPYFDNTNAWKYLKKCLDTNWVSTAGPFINEFENHLSKYCNAPHSIAVTNGTVALRLSLYVVGVRNHDEVMIPPMTFVASANAISHLGACPHFIDIDRNTLGMCPIALERRLSEIGEFRNGKLINKLNGRNIKAILAVHIFGNPAKIIEIKKVAEKWGLPLVEDAAEALGSWVKSTKENIHCGLIGDIGILSFNGNKIISTGGGGAIITKNDELAEITRHLSSTAKIPHKWEFDHDQIAWNDRMPNINAALGLAQIEKISEFLQAKKQLFEKYKKIFNHNKDVELVESRPSTISNNWLITIRIINKDIYMANKIKNLILEESHASGMLCRPVWKLLHKLPMYSDCSSSKLPVAEEEYMRLINLPSSHKIIFDSKDDLI